MSTNYVRMFENVPFSKKDYFFGHFPDVMSFTLLLSYHSAYPRSKSKIDDDGFKQNLLDLCNEWTTGFRTSSVARKGEHWVVDFDMSEGNKNDTATRLKQMDTSGISPGTPGSGGVGGRRKLVLNSRGGKRATSGADPASEVSDDVLSYRSSLSFTISLTNTLLASRYALRQKKTTNVTPVQSGSPTPSATPPSSAPTCPP